MQPPGQYRFFLIPPKVPMKNQATPKKYLPNFRTQKNPRIENFRPKKSFDHPHHLKSRVPPPPPPGLRFVLVQGRFILILRGPETDSLDVNFCPKILSHQEYCVILTSCPWVFKDSSHTLCIYTQEYKWILVNLMLKGNTAVVPGKR